MELFHAHHQWATRPADQRFNTLEEVYNVTRAYAQTAREKAVPWSDIRIAADGQDVVLVGPAGVPANLTHFAFGQVCRKVEAPASYLRELPAEMAANNLNYGLQKYRQDGNAQLLIHKNSSLLVRAATTEVYERLWNWEVAQRLIDAAARFDLVPARQTMVWGGGEVPTDTPAALYASDHDLWCMIMSRDKSLLDPVTGAPIYRGAITWNSEVGASSLGMMTFGFNEMCANHIIWGASNVTQIRMAHKGNIRGKWLDAVVEIRKYLESSATGEQAKLSEAVKVRIAGTKDEVLDKLFGIRSVGLSRKVLEAGFNACQPSLDGDPKSVWGMVQGLTRYSQTVPYADDRQVIDRGAGKLLDLTF